MNITVLTFIYADNYGALLQAFALKEYLQCKGHRVVFLDYAPDKERVFYSTSYKGLYSAKALIKKTFSNLERRDSMMIFEKFRDSHFELMNYKDGVNNCDLLIVGSDQVWNEKIVGDLKPYLFYDCRSSVRRISYAASIGRTDINDETRKLLKEGLKAFSGISVREKSSEELVKSLGYSCTTVVDPVFLLDKQRWLRFAKRPMMDNRNKRYILVYLLRKDVEIISKANQYAQENDLELYYIHPMGKKMDKLKGKRIKAAGPEEFVWLISNAEIVFTNSFHAVAFCSIFDKAFYHVKREDLGNRVTSLLSTLEIKNDEIGVEAQFGDGFNKMYDVSKQFLDTYINDEEEYNEENDC